MDIHDRFNYAEKADSIAKIRDIPSLVIRANLSKILLLKGIGKVQEALILSNSTLGYTIEKNDTNKYYSILLTRGNIYKDLGDFEKAFNDYNEILDYRQRIDDPIGQAKVLMTMAIINAKSRNTQGAIEKLNQADSLLQTFHSNIDKSEFESLRLKIAINQGATYFTARDFPNAKIYFNKALSYLDGNSSNSNRANLLYNIGTIHFLDEKDYGSAMKKFTEAFNIYKKIDNEYYMASTLEMMAEVKAQEKDYNVAKEYALQSLKISQKLNILPELVEINGILSDIYFSVGDYKKAFEVRKEYDHLKDSLLNENKIKAIKEIETKYETEKKDNQIVKLNLENKISAKESRYARYGIYGILLFALLGTTIVIFWFQNFKKRKETEKLQAQIASREQLRGYISGELHDKVCSDLIGARMKLKNIDLNNEASADQVNDLNQFLKDIYNDTHQISKELRSPDYAKMDIRKFIGEIVRATGLDMEVDINIEVGEDVEWDQVSKSVKTLFDRIFRESCTNCLKHANASVIGINITHQKGMISMVITDDGVGIKSSLEGNGIKNMKQRVKEAGGNFAIIDNRESGAEILISIPV